MTFDLNKKNIIIFGATSTIAIEIARKLTAFACHLVLVARDKEALSIVKDDLTARGAVVDLLVYDLAKLESLTEEWLRLNQIQFDYLESKNEALLEKHPSIQFHVDDELDHALFFLRKNIDVYIVKRSDIDYGNVEMFPTLKFVADLNEVLYHISN